MLKEEITPNNLINYLNNVDDVKELKYQNNKNYIPNDSFLERIQKINNKVSEYMNIIDSDEFNNLDLNNSLEKKLHDDILNELSICKEELDILVECVNNYNKMKIKHNEKINKSKYENGFNIFKNNYELFKSFKNNKDTIDINTVPDVFKYMYFIYEKLNIQDNENIEDTYKRFIELYNNNTDNQYYKNSLWNNIFNDF